MINEVNEGFHRVATYVNDGTFFPDLVAHILNIMELFQLLLE